MGMDLLVGILVWFRYCELSRYVCFAGASARCGMRLFWGKYTWMVPMGRGKEVEEEA